MSYHVVDKALEISKIQVLVLARDQKTHHGPLVYPIHTLKLVLHNH